MSIRPPLVWVLLVCSAIVATPAGAEDEQPPTIEHTPPKESAPGEAMVVKATIADESGVFDPALLYRVDATGEFQRAQMVLVPGQKDTYVGTIPGALLGATSSVAYFIEAYDNNGNGPARIGSPEEPTVVPLRAPEEVAPETTVPDDTTTPADPTVDESEGGGLGLWIGIGAGVASAVVVVAAIAAGGIAAVYIFTRPDTPDEVTLQLTAPTPVAAP